MNGIMSVAKIALLALYAAAIASRFVPALADKSNVLIGASLILLAIHLVEFLVLKNKLKVAAPGQSHFLPTFLFGVAHSLPILGKHKA